MSCPSDYETLMKPSIQHSPEGLISPVYQNNKLKKNNNNKLPKSSIKASDSSLCLCIVYTKAWIDI